MRKHRKSPLEIQWSNHKFELTKDLGIHPECTWQEIASVAHEQRNRGEIDDEEHLRIMNIVEEGISMM